MSERYQTHPMASRRDYLRTVELLSAMVTSTFGGDLWMDDEKRRNYSRKQSATVDSGYEMGMNMQLDDTSSSNSQHCI